MLCPVCRAPASDDDLRCTQCGNVRDAFATGSVLADRYELGAELGRGGMGAVYRAHDRVLDEDVALKFLRPEAGDAIALQRLRQEIRLARKVTHPNVCRVYDYHEEGSAAFITMEWIPGRTLRDVRRSEELSWQQALDMAIQIATGLSAIHRLGIVHRDLKTANVMRDAEGNLRILDFGIAKSVQPGQIGLSATGMIVGTPEFLSPEQARGEPLDARSDIYSAGIVLYELLCGHVPFKADTPIGTVIKQLEEEPPLEPLRQKGVPEAVVQILRRALDKDRERRFASADELAEALRTARAAPPPPPTATLTKPVPTPPALTGAERPSSQPVGGPWARRSSPLRRTALGVTLGLGLVAWLAVRMASAPDAFAPGSLPASPRVQRSVPQASPVPAVTIEAATALEVTPARVRRPSPKPDGPRASATAPPLPLETPSPPALVLAIGTPLRVRITTELRSDRARAGDAFVAVLAEPAPIGPGQVLAPGTAVSGRVEAVGRLESPRGRPYMELSLQSVRWADRELPVRTGRYRAVAPESAPANITAVVIGAVAGAGLGAIVDGKAGIAPGQVVGAAVGSALAPGSRSGAFVFGDSLTFKVAARVVLEAR